MNCEKLQGCPFYNGKMKIDEGMGALYKKKYCEGDKINCARYMVSSAVGSEYVTDNLYPNMINKANKIIEEVRSKK